MMKRVCFLLILEKKAQYSSFKLVQEQVASEAVPPELLKELYRRQLIYRGGLREVCTCLEFIDDQFHAEYDHNPIHHMECRMKSMDSILEKARRRGCEMTADSICGTVRDIAGVRVICNYIDDVYRLAELLMKQECYTVVKVRDYIRQPKENGYRSLHLVIAVPVYFLDGCEEVFVEVQLRTVAMDFWASLEHQLRYKQNKDISSRIDIELKACAEVSATLDRRMQKIFDDLNKMD